MFRLLPSLLIAALATPLAMPVAAQQVETVFTQGAWIVNIVKFDDGELACSAEVTQGRDTFAIWAYADGFTQLQFYSPNWQFEDGTANLVVQVDRRTEWTLNNAKLTGNSVLFALDDDRSAVDFLIEVARGNTVYVRNAQGQSVISYTLAGSRASMDVLAQCEEALGGLDANPFK
jgi:hypothetical protein